MNIRKVLLTATLLVCAAAFASAAAMKLKSGTATYVDKNGKTVTLKKGDTVPTGVSISLGDGAVFSIGGKVVEGKAGTTFAWSGANLSVTDGSLSAASGSGQVQIGAGQTAVIKVDESKTAVAAIRNELSLVTVTKTTASNNALQDVQTTQNNNPVSPSAP